VKAALLAGICLHADILCYSFLLLLLGIMVLLTSMAYNSTMGPPKPKFTIEH